MLNGQLMRQVPLHGGQLEKSMATSKQTKFGQYSDALMTLRSSCTEMARKSTEHTKFVDEIFMGIKAKGSIGRKCEGSQRG